MNNKYENQKELLLCSSANMWSALDNKHFDHFQSQLFYSVRFSSGMQKIQGRVDNETGHLSKSPPTFLRCTCLSLKMLWPSSFQRGRTQPPKTIEVPALWLSQSQNTWLALFQLMEDAWVPSACILLRILLIIFPPHIFQATLLPKKCKRIPQNHWARTLGKERKLLPLLWIILATSYQMMT